jgi:hypothetical protein
MAGGGKGGGESQPYQPAPTPDTGPSAEQLAEQERQRQEENAAQLERQRQQAGQMGEQTTLGNSEEEKKKKPTLLGGNPTTGLTQTPTQ